MLTNSSALTAIRTLRGAQQALSATSARISTGLKVASAQDNPAFFLVATQTRADIGFLKGVRDNLNYGLGAVRTARAAQDQLVNVIDNVTAAIIQIESGSAIKELGAVIQEQIELVRDVISDTSFNGVNLLKGNQVETFTAGLVRGRDSVGFPQIQVQGIGLGVEASLENGFVDGDFEDASGAWVLGSGRVVLQTATSYGAFSSSGATRLSFGDGQNAGGQASQTFATTAGVEYALTFDYGANAAANLQQMNIRVDGGASLLNETVSDTGSSPMSYETYSFSFIADSASTTLVFDDVSATSTNTDGNIDNVSVTALGGVISQTQFGAASLIQLLELADPLTNPSFSTETALRALNAARARVAVGFSLLGQAERQIENRQAFLGDLTDSLEEGVAALVEADLAEESARLIADQTRLELASLSLNISNDRFNVALQLYR